MRFSFKKILEFLGKSPFSLGFQAGRCHFGAVGVFMRGKLAESKMGPAESGIRGCRHTVSSYPRAPGPAYQKRLYLRNFNL